MIYYVNTAGSEFSTVTNTAQDITIAMESSKEYEFISTVACWICQGENPTASAAAGSKFCGASEKVILNGGHGAVLSVVRAVGDGSATLTPITVVR